MLSAKSTKKAAPPKKLLKRRYDDDEAECSSGASADESEGANEYDLGMDMMKPADESDSEGDEDAVAALRMRQALEDKPKRFKASGARYVPKEGEKREGEKRDGEKRDKGDSKGEGELKMATGNKRLNFPIPAQPKEEEKDVLPMHLRWSLRFDSKAFRRAVKPALKALPMCFFRFDIVEQDGEINAGLTIQAFDNPATMGYFSRVRVSIVPGVDDSGAKLTLKSLHNSNFGLTSANLEKAIVVASASNPSASLQFMMFNTNPDKLTVKSVADGSTMMSTFNVALLKKASTDSPIPALMMKAAKEKEEKKRLVFRITAQLLRQQGEVAKRIGSDDLRFEVSRAKAEGEEMKYRLSVLWSGAEIEGRQDSFVGTVVRRAPATGIPLFRAQRYSLPHTRLTETPKGLSGADGAHCGQLGQEQHRVAASELSGVQCQQVLHVSLAHGHGVAQPEHWHQL